METPEIHNIDKILTFLRGGTEIALNEFSKENSDIMVRCVTYLLKKKYHRRNLIEAVISLLNNSPKTNKGVAWQLIQQIPLSHLLEILKVLKKKDNTKRLRHAMAYKLATLPKNELLRAYFMFPDAYRRIFKTLYLPREIFNDKTILNKKYQLAHLLSTLSLPKALEELNLEKLYLLKNLRLPFEKIMNLELTPEEIVGLAKFTHSDSFIHHSRWFKDKLEEDEYGQIALEKIKRVQNPLQFLSIRSHLEETGSLTTDMIKYLEDRAKKILKDLMDKFNLERLALLVDKSGSMQVAVELTTKLYEGFSQMSVITDLITFSGSAFTLDLEQLREIIVGGSTSIGSAIVLLKKRIDERKKKIAAVLTKEDEDILDDLLKEQIPQAIILVTDLQENAQPLLNPVLKLMNPYDNPPLIVIHCGIKEKMQINYPHAIIEVDDFHKSLIMDVIKNIAQLTSKVAIEEKQITEVLTKRKPIEEEIGTIELSLRPRETYQKGYLEKVLCSENPEDYIVIKEDKTKEKQSKSIETARAKKEKAERESIEKIKRITKISNRIKLDMMRKILKMSEEVFNENILTWAEEMGLKISGDYLTVNTETMDNFFEKLEVVVRKVVSERDDEFVKLFSDLDVKVDGIKDTTELILVYSKKIEEVMDGIDDLEDFLVQKLGSDFEKIKHIWEQYKSGEIGKAKLIKDSALIIGKKFIKIFLKKK